MDALKLLLFVTARQLWARKGMSAIALLGVALGVLTHVAVSGLMDGTTDTFLSTILQVSPHLVVKSERLERHAAARPAGFEEPSAVAFVTTPRGESRLRIQRPMEVADAIQTFPGVVASSPFVAGTAVIGTAARERPVELRGIVPGRQNLVTPLRGYVLAGSYDALAAVPDGALVGSLAAEHLGVKVGDRFTCVAAGARTSLVIVGIFETKVSAVDRGRIFVGLRQAQAILGRSDDVDGIDVRLADPERAPEVTRRVERAFGYDGESWQEANANFLGLLAQQKIAVDLVIAALLTVGGFGILAIQIVIVGQKRRDIAILRSLGFRRADVLVIFLAQGIAIAVLGSILGSVLGHFTVSWLRTVPAGGEGGTVFRAELLPVAESVLTYAAGTTFASLVGSVASLVPALRASRVEPVDVLRGQA